MDDKKLESIRGVILELTKKQFPNCMGKDEKEDQIFSFVKDKFNEIASEYLTYTYISVDKLSANPCSLGKDCYCKSKGFNGSYRGIYERDTGFCLCNVCYNFSKFDLYDPEYYDFLIDLEQEAADIVLGI